MTSRGNRLAMTVAIAALAGSAFAAATDEPPKRDPKLHERLERALGNEDRIREALAGIQAELQVIKIRSTRSTGH